MVDKKNNGKGDEPVNLNREVVERVRKNKVKTGVPISTFIEKATIKELDHQQSRDAEKVFSKK